MSESHEHAIPPEDLEKIPEPTESDWEEFCLQVKALEERYQLEQKIFKDAGNEVTVQLNYHDIVGNLLVVSKLISRKKLPVNRRESDLYYRAVKYNSLVEEYFKLINNYSGFKSGEFSPAGAFPEILKKYFGNEEQVKKDGYTNYREAYIQESAKLLEAESK